MVQPRPTAKDLFEILAHEHADMLCAFLRGLVLRDDLVDDLFQDTMIVAWRRLGDYDRTRPFAPWLRGIAWNLVQAQRRRAGRERFRCPPGLGAALEEHAAALDRVPGDAFRDRAETIRACLERLPKLLREAVELTYGRGLLLAQIAVSVDANEEAVKKRVQRARVMLARCMRGRGAGLDQEMETGGAE